MPSKITLNIVGMSCVNCSNAIERVSRKIEGVQEAHVNFANGSGEFVLADPALEETLKAKIKKLGYDIAVDYEDLERKKRRNLKAALFRLILALILAAVVMAVEMSGFLSFVPKALLCAAMACVSLFYCGKNFFYHAYGSLKNRSFDMNVLVAMGSFFAFAYSLTAAAWVYTHGAQNEFTNLYFSSASMIIAFISLGKYLEERSKMKANDYIKGLIDLSPKTALLIKDDGTIAEVRAEALKPGDKVLVKNGSRIPCDGLIVEGGAQIDTSLISGESLAVYKSVGDEVNAGCVSTDGVIYVKVTKFPHQTLLAEIKNLLNEAGNKKMPIARFADKISNIFVPAVILIALASFIAWMALDGRLSYAASAAICVLIISCPCALGLATPIAIVCAISNAAKAGILIKNPEILEILKDADVAVFDKTGTLSKGEISVSFSDLGAQDLYALASAQKLSEHPISKAIVKFAELKFGEISKFNGEFESIAGKGIVAKNPTGEILCGSAGFLRERGVDAGVEVEAEELLDKGFGVVYCAIGGSYAGFIAFSDEIRAEARGVIQTLQNSGVKTVMLTGDNAKTANFVARNLGIDEVKSGVLPSGKYEFIKSLTDEGKRVLFVGDGVNDAPSLKAASIGIAMNGGSDVAKGAGDVIFIKNDLASVLYLFRLSEAAMRTIKQNLFWALFYNAVCIPIAAGALYPGLGVLLKPMYGAAAMCFSSVTVVLNSIRLKFAKF